MEERVRTAYVDHLLDLTSRGIIDDSLTDVDVKGKAVEQRMIDALRAADRLLANVKRDLEARRTT